jgi:hypothetical protein
MSDAAQPALKDGSHFPVELHTAEVATRQEQFGQILQAVQLESETRQAGVKRVHGNIAVEEEQRRRETEHLELDLIPELVSVVSINVERARQARILLKELAEENEKLSDEIVGRIRDISAAEMVRTEQEEAANEADKQFKWMHTGNWGHTLIIPTQSVANNATHAWSYMNAPSWTCCGSANQNSRGCTAC